MAEDGSKAPTSVNFEESDDLEYVTVKLVLDGFKVDKQMFQKAKPKAGHSTVEIIINETDLDVTVTVGTGASRKTYRYHVNQLPGPVDKEKSTVEYKKEQIVLKLIKKQLDSWAVRMRNGLDQAPSDH